MAAHHIPAHSPPANNDMSMKLITAPPWIDPPMFMCASVGNMRADRASRPVGLEQQSAGRRGEAPAREVAPAEPAGMFGIGRGAASGRDVFHQSLRRRSWLRSLSRPLGDQLLDLGDRLGRVEALGADVRAVHDRVAAIEAERVLELVEPLAGRLVAAVGEPAIGLEQDRRAEELVGVPPIARAAGRAAGAQDALVEAVELRAVLGRLQPLARRRRARRSSATAGSRHIARRNG